MFPKAEVVQIDTEPLGLHNGMKSADLHLRADAKLAAAEALKRLRERGAVKANIRSSEVARRIRDEPADGAQFPIEPGLLDPRRAIEELDRVIPKDYDSVSGAGHQAYFHSTMRGRKPENYHAIREFGAIGNGISLAIGVAAAKKNGKTVLFEGDGSLLMHIQELEMVQRHRLKLLICVLNDGAYGSEVHKLRADGIDDSGSIFGRTDLASIAKGFGLRGTTVTDVRQLKPLFDAYQAQGTAELWNIHVSDRVVSPSTRRTVGRGHGKM
jgi:thiamine pyrophosphate-dependent acetolactate synthase large subunit-like protein